MDRVCNFKRGDAMTDKAKRRPYENAAQKAKRLQDEDAAVRAAKEKEINATAQRLLTIWENRIPPLTSYDFLPLTRKEKLQLEYVFRIVFRANIDCWSKFVDMIADSDFLMGRYKYSDLPINFGRVTLVWAIMPENCLLIKAGAYSNDNFDKRSIFGCGSYGGYLTPMCLASSMGDELERLDEDGWSVRLTRTVRES
jgi:hypothetical protein